MNISARYLCQGKAVEGGDAVTLLTDGAVCQWHTFSTDRSGVQTNAALAQRVGAEFIEISAMQY